MESEDGEAAASRQQIDESCGRPSLQPSHRKYSRASFPRFRCCLCHVVRPSVRKGEGEKRREPLAQIQGQQCEEREDEFKVGISTNRGDRAHRSRLSYHRYVEQPAAVLYGHESTIMPSKVYDSNSSAEFLDARDYLSPTEGCSGSLSSSAKAASAKIASFRPKSILRYCQCETCMTAMRELGMNACFQNADICDNSRERKEKVKLYPELKVVEYDIRSGKIRNEWVQDLNINEAIVPVGFMENTLWEGIDIRRNRARERLRNLFGADQCIELEENEDHDRRYEDVEDDGLCEESFEIEIEPPTLRTPASKR